VVDDRVIVRILESELPGLVGAWRFGSTVTGSERADSDVDVAVLGPGTLSPEVRLRVSERLAEALHRDVDLVDLRRASTVLRLQVVAHGQALPLGDADARGAFEDRVFSDYARLNEERREILEQVAREGRIHGG
jgi:predicted nucleotidyltransferase